MKKYIYLWYFIFVTPCLIQANPKVDSLKLLISQYPTKDTTYCQLLKELTDVYWITIGQLDSTEVYSNELLEAARLVSSRTHETRALFLLAQIQFFRGDFTTAENTVKQVISKYDSPEKKARAYNFASSIKIKQGNFQEAIRYLELAKKKQPTTNDKAWFSFMTVYHHNLSVISGYKEDRVEAFNQKMLAYQYATKTQDNYKIAIASLNIAGNYTSFQDYDQANKYLEEVLNISTDPVILSQVYDRLMRNSVELGCLSEAHDYFEKALALKNEIGEFLEIGTLYIIHSKAYLLEHQLDSAAHYAQKGLEISKSQGALREISAGYFMLSRIAAQQQDYLKALHYFKQGEAQGLVTPYYINEHIARVHKKLNNWQVAYKFLEKSNEQKDSIFNASSILAVNSGLLTHRFSLEKERQQLINDKQEAVLQAQITQQRGILGLAAATILILGIGTFLINKWYREKKAANALIAAQKEGLQQANDIKSKIFYVLGHDLRGPVGNVDTLFSEILKGTISLDEFKELLPFLKKNTAGVSLTLNNILHWGLAQTKQLKVVPEIVNIQHEVKLAKALLEGLMQQKRITFIDKVQDELVVKTDNAKLNLIIRNLIANSIKYTPPEGQIEVSTSTTNDEVIISVHDNGVGMSPEIQATLFDSPVSQDGTNREKGTGIGLNLCKQMLEEMGGRIWVKSQLNHGSTFSFALPM